MSKWLIERSGIKITVNAKTSDAEDLVLAALHALSLKSVKTAQGIRLSVDQADEQWLLADRASKIDRKIKQTGDLIYHLTDRIVFHLADKVEDAHCLHAAAVAHNDLALVIPASSGSGKSTFTTWLVANGFHYLTDELIIIDKQRHISGVARPIQIKSHGVDAVMPLITKSEHLFPGKLANAVTVEALGGVVSELPCHRLATMIFPKYSKDADYNLTKLSSAQAGMNLMANHVNARNLEGHGFREMMAIIRNTPCYSLKYGGFEKLPSDFASQLKAILTA